MNSGCDQALYLLPFDHRHSYVESLFKLGSPLSAFFDSSRQAASTGALAGAVR